MKIHRQRAFAKYVSDHLTKREAWNKGWLPQYYAEDTHPAIIDMETLRWRRKLWSDAEAILRTKKG